MLKDYKEGEVILIDKDLNWTSFDVVKKIRNIIKVKIGHAGTLDPMATGLLILCTGKFTKRIDEFQGMDKWYEGTFRIGTVTPSYDRETEEKDHVPYAHISEKDLKDAAMKLTGELQQVPPVYSAIKIKGERAYDKARSGEEVQMKPRNVTIHTFEITGYQLPEVSFRIKCSKGTYIRSVARDFGVLLGTGAYLTSLRRTAIGDLVVEDALTVAEFEKINKKNSSQ